jgi:hypothetical protein
VLLPPSQEYVLATGGQPDGTGDGAGGNSVREAYDVSRFQNDGKTVVDGVWPKGPCAYRVALHRLSFPISSPCLQTQRPKVRQTQRGRGAPIVTRLCPPEIQLLCLFIDA